MDGSFDVEPLYKRGLIWTQKQQCQFIESILLGLPTQPLWVEEQYDGNWVLLDGTQRILSLINFVENGFKLTGLQYLVNLNNLYFRHLPPQFIMKIEDGYVFNVVTLSPDIDEELCAEVFRRLNAGGAPLTVQEVRNFINQGKPLEALRDLASIFEDFFVFECHSAKKYLEDEFVLKLSAVCIQESLSQYREQEALDKLMPKLPEFNVDIKNTFMDIFSQLYDIFGAIKVIRRSSWYTASSLSKGKLVLSDAQFKLLFALFVSRGVPMNQLSSKSKILEFFSGEYFNPKFPRNNLFHAVEYISNWVKS